jgi:hypothetical protein
MNTSSLPTQGGNRSPSFEASSTLMGWFFGTIHFLERAFANPSRRIIRVS